MQQTDVSYLKFLGTSTHSSVSLVANLDSAVLGKIKKALALGGHQATGEAEAKTAMRSVIVIRSSIINYTLAQACGEIDGSTQVRRHDPNSRSSHVPR